MRDGQLVVFKNTFSSFKFGNSKNVEKIEDIEKIKSYHLKVHRCEYIIQKKERKIDVRGVVHNYPFFQYLWYL